jgi:hypothetical protein
LQKRVFANGDVKYVYPDGQTVTKCADGRLRVKDKNGTILSDTYPSSDSASTLTASPAS